MEYCYYYYYYYYYFSSFGAKMPDLKIGRSFPYGVFVTLACIA